MNPARRGKMNDKPKDRIAMWMSIIAYILVLMIVIALGVLIYAIVTGANIETVVFCLLCLVFLAIALRWKAVGGVFFVIIGLFFVFVDVTDIITYGIVSLLADIFVLTGLLPLIAGLLFLAIWRRTRIAKVPTSSD
jgi:membrane-bound ClpP family serine protease